MNPLFHHALAAWRYCLRTRLFMGVGVLGIVVMAFSLMIASFSLRQPMVVAMDVGISCLRILGALLTILWVQELYFKDIDRKWVLSLFAYPVHRSAYVLGRYFGLLLVIAMALLYWGVCLEVMVAISGAGYDDSTRPVAGQYLLIEMLGVFVDLLVIAAFILFIVSISETLYVGLFAGLAFVLISRSLGDVIGYLQFYLDEGDPLRTSLLPVLNLIRWVVPDLGRLDIRPAVLYGNAVDWNAYFHALLSALGYWLLMLVGAVINYNKREFA